MNMSSLHITPKNVKGFMRIMKKAKVNKFDVKLTVSKDKSTVYRNNDISFFSENLDKLNRFDQEIKEYVLSIGLPEIDKTYDVHITGNREKKEMDSKITVHEDN